MDKALQRLTCAGSLRRVDRGLYDKPSFHILTRKSNPPSPRQVIEAIAHRDQIRVLVDGMAAANDLGLTNAVPAKIVVHADARLKSVSLGQLGITFKPTAASKLYWAGRPAMRIVQTLHWLRDTMGHVDDDAILKRHLNAILHDPKDGPALRADLFVWPVDAAELDAEPVAADFERTGRHMMNSAFDQVIAADDETRLGLYTTTAQCLGTTPQNVEKDFWVCWRLDALSKGFGVIKRFSEDIDVTAFRDDLGEAASITELEAFSGKKRGKALDAIKAACEAYINGSCLAELSAIIGETTKRNGLSTEQFRIESDPEDSQALYVRYPTATPDDAYVGKAVKIKSGAKSALDPNSDRVIRTYLESDIPDIALSVGNVTTVDPERTFWDKVVILHGLRRWFDNRGELKGNGQRVSRHYYDLHQLLASDTGQRALKDRELGADCVAHAACSSIARPSILRRQRPHILSSSRGQDAR